MIACRWCQSTDHWRKNGQNILYQCKIGELQTAELQLLYNYFTLILCNVLYELNELIKQNKSHITCNMLGVQ